MIAILVVVLGSILAASGCATDRDVTDEQSTTAAGTQTGSQAGTADRKYNADRTDTYGYSRGSGLSGQPLAGLDAQMMDRVVYFDFDSAEVRFDARAVVEAHARYLSKNASVNAVLEGHTDERGTREYNIGLGERRAEAIRRLMNAYGVAPQQISTISYGEERPAVAGQSEASYEQNRRVEIVY